VFRVVKVRRSHVSQNVPRPVVDNENRPIKHPLSTEAAGSLAKSVLAEILKGGVHVVTTHPPAGGAAGSFEEVGKPVGVDETISRERRLDGGEKGRGG
jgi:hypothetical protein